jgi:hypothetical protein
MTPIRRLALVAATILAVGAGPLVTEADAKHKHNRYCDHDRDGRYDRYERLDGRYRNDRNLRYDSGRCADVQRRISKARYEIQKNEGTGRHEDALRWFKNDLRKAHAERVRYCGGRGGAWGWDDVYYDRDDYDRYDDGRYDPYYGGREDFELKRDWPALLGLFMGGGANLGY